MIVNAVLKENSHKGCICSELQWSQGVSELIVVEYQSEKEAYTARKRLIQLKTDHQADVADAVIATVDADGHVKLDQLVNQWTVNTKGGSLIGLLYGAMFAHPVLGAAVGAGVIALSNAVSDYGIGDKFMTDTAEMLQPGQSALFIMLRQLPSDHVIDVIATKGGKVIRTGLDAEAVGRLDQLFSTV
ncbi:DUF1269 domain-containing protein [Roseovarius sp. 2305UL8-3]|uniref:DUF1269 domain-containing protein n=1 Tax=Roseovarius conchicola TaxID=3121636 RepID=UPI003528A944